MFIAGGTSGINQGIAEAFARKGATVGVISRSQDKVDAAVDRIKSLGAPAFGAAADVRKPETIQAALEAFHAEHGGIDVLVSGAAGNFLAAALDMSPNAFKTVIEIDLIGTFNVLRMAHAFLRKPGASVINISAPQSTTPTRLQSHACAAKAGIDMLTRCLALEWGPEVRVNAIVPGPIEGTEGIARLVTNPEAERRMLASTPLGRMGDLGDCADAALFLSSPMADYITGAILPVDGGRTIAGGSDYGSQPPRRNV